MSADYFASRTSVFFASAVQARLYHQQFVYPKLSPHHRILLLPPAMGSVCEGYGCSLDCWTNQTHAIAQDTYAWAQEDDRVVAIAPYRLTTNPGPARCDGPTHWHATDLGLESLPQTFELWKAIGRNITSRTSVRRAKSDDGRHTTLWLVPNARTIDFARRHADAVTRIMLGFKCIEIEDNGTVKDNGHCHNSTLRELQQQTGVELWPEIHIAAASMLNGTWKKTFAPDGSLGKRMRQDFNWSGVVLDLEEMSDNRLCRQRRCGGPNKQCAACVPKVSASQYTTFVGEFSAALHVFGLRLQICVGEIGPISALQTSGVMGYLDAMAPSMGKVAIMNPFCECRNGRLGPLIVAATLTRPFLRTDDQNNAKQQHAVIAGLKSRILQVNPMFGGSFNATVRNGTQIVNTSLCPRKGSSPPCPRSKRGCALDLPLRSPSR